MREKSPLAETASRSEHDITVLLIDDQAIIGEAVRRMLQPHGDIHFHYCNDPTQAIEMANEIRPTVILQDLVMPQLDGLTLVKYLRANESTRQVPLIVLSTKEEATTKAEAFALGANDYLVKLPDPVEVIARIRYHSQSYIRLLERNEAYDALAASQAKLAAELQKAAEYVKRLLPDPLETDSVRTLWRFIPSMDLGGDAFGYHWLDEDHFAMYLLDVCGHGVGAALLSVSAMNVLRTQTLRGVDFYQPDQVLRALNHTFPMEEHNNMFFTIWYGVYEPSSKKLTCCVGGHHPAYAITPDGKALEFSGDGPMIGGWPDAVFKSQTYDFPADSKLYIFCDGVFEIHQPDGEYWSLEQFVDVLKQPSQPGLNDLDRILASVRAVRGKDVFSDDLSLLQVQFCPPDSP